MKRLLKLLAPLTLVAALVAPAPALAQTDPVDQGPETYSADLIAQAQARSAAASGGVSLLDAPATQGVPSDWRVGVATVGKGRFIGVRVSFPAAEDGSEPAMTITSRQTRDNFAAAFNGGDAGELAEDAPFDNLHDFYERASYGKLDLRMVAVVDYTAKHNRDYYTDRATELFYETLAGIDDQADFTQCDANDDGYIDGIFLQFAGHRTGWGTTWWPAMHSIDTPPAGYEGPTTFDGKTPCESVVVDGAEEDSKPYALIGTLCHETGHVLGLPDLYSYRSSDDAGLCGLRVTSLMNDSYSDIDAYSKWMLGWIDDADITRVHVSKDGIDVRRGTGAVEHVDGELDETLAAIETSSEAARPGFLAISSDASILEGNLFCNFYLVHYAQPVKNDSRPHILDGSGFRVFRVQGGLDQQGRFIYSNTQGPAHEQMIEGLTDLDRYNNGRVWTAGESITPDTSPSTNFRESSIDGFTGIVLNFKKTGGDAGEIAISYADAKPAEPLTIEYTGPAALSNRAKLTFKLSRSALPNYGATDQPRLLVDGKERGSSSCVFDEKAHTLTYTAQLPLDALTASSKLQLEIPAGYFVLGYDASGQPELSDACTADLPTAKVYKLAASGTYASVAGGGAVSDIVEVGGAQRFLTFNGYSSDTGRLRLCTLSADGKDCSAVDVTGVGDLPGDSFGTIDVMALDDNVLFCRLMIQQTSVAVRGLWIDASTGAVLAQTDMGAQSEPAKVSLVRAGDDVATVYQATDGSWTVNTYRRAGDTATVESASVPTFGGYLATSIVDAGEGYVAALPGSSVGAAKGSFGLWKAKGAAADFCQGDPDITLAIDQLSLVNAVRVAGDRVYVQALVDRMADGKDNFVDELLIYDLKGNLIKSADVDGLPFFPSSGTVRLRVSQAGLVAVLVDEAGLDGDPVKRTHAYLFDADFKSCGDGYTFSSGAGAWMGGQWLATDWDASVDEWEASLRWYLSADIGSGDPVDPVDPDKPVDPSDPIGPGAGGGGSGKPAASGVSAAAAKKAAGATVGLADTGDRTFAIVVAVAGLGIVALVAGVAVALGRRKR